MAEWRPEWRFAEMTPAQIALNPVQGEFFTAAADVPERLVRESIQNSMDAALGGQPVRVRFAFSGSEHDLSTTDAGPYLDGLGPHLDAVTQEKLSVSSGTSVQDETRAVYEAYDLLDRPLEYLVVEDFGTRGLTGDVLANGANEAGNNFWGFFRQVGISTKGQDEAGSWGLGKWVFPDASRINALIAVTRRAGESDTLAMGLAILKTHQLGDSRYPAYGHFAAADEADDAEWFPMPVRSRHAPAFLQQAEHDFQLQRGQESGLSVIIPWPKAELTPASIARAVITQYFLPIMRGRLEVIIQHPYEEDRLIDAEHIFEELEWIDESERDEESPQSLQGLLDLARWADTEVTDHDLIRIPLPSSRSNPLKEHSAFNIEELRERYQRGERLAFELRTEITEKMPRRFRSTFCRVYLEQAEELEQGHDYFVRGDLLIPKMDHLTRQRARSLLLVDGDSPLGHLLRDSEGPAHAEWQKSAERVKENWVGAGVRIDDVRRAPVRLVQALVERPVQRQLDALADLFPSDIASPREAASGNTSNSTSRGRSPLPPTPQPSPVRLRHAAGGFELLGNPQFPLAINGTSWRVRFAYALARGSKNRAFSQFEQGVKDECPDFSIRDGLDVNLQGCQAQTTGHNQLEISVDDEQFSVSVVGFDPNRDVLVEVDRIADAALLDSESADEAG